MGFSRMVRAAGVTDIEMMVQSYYGDRPLMERIENALRAAGVDPEKPSHRDLWPFDQLHSRGIAATRENAERARIQAGSMCSTSVAASVGRLVISRLNAAAAWRRSTSPPTS